MAIFRFNKWFHLSYTAAWSWLFSLLAFSFLIGFTIFLFWHGLQAFINNGASYIFKADWHYRASLYGSASMVYGSFVVCVIALFFSVPLSLGSAILTSEYLSGKWRFTVKSIIEFLAGIPSVVYGLLGILFLRSYIFDFFQPFHPESGDNLLTAGLLVGLMVLPTIMSLADDAFRAVPREDRENARALGLTQRETFFHAVFPKAFPGVVAAVLLGLGRALGETIAVYLVVGRADNRLPDPWFSLRPLLEAGQTLTSKLGGSEVNIAYGNSEHWSALMGLGCLLFFSVIVFVLISEFILITNKKYQS